MNWLTTFSIIALSVLVSREASADDLLVLEKGTKTLAIIDPKTLRIMASVPAGADPHEVVTSDDGTRAYVSNYGGEGSALNTISVADLTTRQPLPAIDLGALHSAHGLDFAGGNLYFTAESNKVIGRYDPKSSRIDWVMGSGQDRTHMILVAPDLKHIYTTNARSGSVSIFESSSRPAFGPPPASMVTVWDVTNVSAGKGAEGFDVSSDGRALWAANAQDGTVTVIDLVAKKASETFAIPVRGANRLKFTPDGRYALISALASDHANLIVIDAHSHALVKTMDLGGGAAGILISPDGSRAYVAVSRADKVMVVDLKSLDIAGQIGPLHQPDGMAWAKSR
jgi:DNA-binding beta-propeller fold protein YncE